MGLNTILKANIEGTEQELYPKVYGDNVYLDDKTTLTPKIAEMVEAINAKAKDTDVMDIKIKYDGSTANTPGDAVREQISELKGDIADLVEIDSRLTSMFVDESVFSDNENTAIWKTTNGVIQENSSYCTSNFYPCKIGDRLTYSMVANNSNIAVLVIYDESKKFIKNAIIGEVGVVLEGTYTFDTNGYFRICVSKSWISTYSISYNEGVYPHKLNDDINNIKSDIEDIYGKIQPLSFAGKKIACFGDSITEFGDYPNRLAEKTGATVYKCGFAGCRWSTYGATSNYSKMCMSYISDYISSGEFTELITAANTVKTEQGDDNTEQANLVASIDYSTLDYMILFWGTNDYGGNIPIGNDTDEGHDTLKGAINLVVKNILTRYPNIHLLFIAPFWRATYTGVSDFCDSDTYTNPLGFKLPQYVDAIVERAKALHIPCVNLYDNMCINKYNYTHWLTDGLHPKQGIGYEYVTQKIVSGLTSNYNK